MKVLAIGYGNRLRGDDGVGPAVVERVGRLFSSKREKLVRALAVHQLTPELAAEIARSDVVWFVDAWANGRGLMVQKVSVDSSAPSSDHGWSPGVLLYLAKSLYGAEPIAYHLLIPATQFDYGETFSELACSGVKWAIRAIAASVEEDVYGHA